MHSPFLLKGSGTAHYVVLLAIAIVLAAAPSALAQERADGARVEEGIEFARPGGQPLLLDAYLGEDGAGPQPGVILIHGGSWQTGGRDDLAKVGQELVAQRGWPSFSIEYRLEERQGHPAEVEDVQAAVRWLRDHAATYGVDPANIILLGGSAGGHLAALAGALGEGPLDAGSRVRAVVAWSGPMDLTLLAETNDGLAANVEGFLGCTLADCPDLYADASPLTHLDATDPPMFVANSTDERIPLNQAEAMVGTLQQVGVTHELLVVSGDRHGKQLRNVVLEDTLAFLDSQLGLAGPGQPSPSTVPPTTAPGDRGDSSGTTLGGERSGRGDADEGGPLWLLGAVGLAVLALVALVLVRQRRRRPQPTGPLHVSEDPTEPERAGVR